MVEEVCFYKLDVLDFMYMWNGRKKAITFSFDDGIRQDLRMIALLDKYNLKATFNLNSGLFGKENPYETNGRIVERTRVEPEQIKNLYANHEVAVHTVEHLNLTELSDALITWQVEEDRKKLETLIGKDIRCMAYPCGGINNNDHVATIIKETSKIRFARTITSSHSFDIQENLLRFNPTLHFREDELFELAEKFISLNTNKLQLFYVWGHTYELDFTDGVWERFEEFCRLISGRQDIFYGTNTEVCLEIK